MLCHLLAFWIEMVPKMNSRHNLEPLTGPVRNQIIANLFVFLSTFALQDLDAVIACITGKASANQPGIRRYQALEPTIATQNAELASTNLLNELDRAAQVSLDFPELH